MRLEWHTACCAGARGKDARGRMRFAATQHQHDLETWVAVGEFERAAVQLGHGVHHAQPEADPGSAAARIAAIETLQHFGFFGILDAGTVIRHRDLGRGIRAAPYGDIDRAILARILERIVDQIAEGLREQDWIAHYRQRPLAVKRELYTLQFRRRRIELDGGRSQIDQIEGLKSRTAHTRVDFRQPQQGIENTDYTVDVCDRGVYFAESPLG